MFDRVLITPLPFFSKVAGLQSSAHVTKKWTPSQVFFKDFGNLAGTPI